MLWVATTASYVGIVPGYLEDIPEEGGLIPLDLNYMWLESMKVTLNATFCSAKVIVIKGVSCNDLPKRNYTSANSETSSHDYALPGSRIDFNISEYLITSQHGIVHVWITPDIDSYEKLVFQTKDEEHKHYYYCSDHKQNQSDPLQCISVDSATEVHYDVKKPGYYFYLLANSTDRSAIYKNESHIQWCYNYVTCDLNAIMEKYSNDSYDIPCRSEEDHSHGILVNHTKVVIPHSFADLSTSFCTLLQLDCSGSGGFSPVTVTNLRYRRDLIVLMFIVYLAAVSFSSVLVLMIMVAHGKCIKHSLL